MNILAIGCHPDDVEIACSGTLAKCVKRGDKVIVCHVSNGNLGHVIIPPDELAVIRKNEAKKAGSLAGIEVICADFEDLNIYDNNKEARERIIDVIRYANPDVIITHNPDDYTGEKYQLMNGCQIQNARFGIFFIMSEIASRQYNQCAIFRVVFSGSYFMLFILNIAFSESSITADVFTQSSMPLKKAESRQAASIFISAPGTQSSG